VPATSVHMLPCAYRRLAFLCPTLQRPARSTTVSPRARSLLLLGNSASKFDVSGVERRRHISKPVSIRGISSPPYRAMERSYPMLWLLQHVAFNIWLYSAGYMTAHFTQINKFSENNIHGRKTVCDTAVKSNLTHLTHFIQFRDRASLVYWKSGTFLMNQAHL
jgi:hypothetical protein